MIYKITLEPLDWFFFGGQNTFDNGAKQSYIAHSNMFPQQSSLLGMLRYQLLKQKDLLTKPGKTPDTDETSTLIGPDSFMMDKDSQDFGKIKGLTPVFIEKETVEMRNKGKNQERTTAYRSFFPASLTDGYKLTFESNVKVNLNGQEKQVLINDNESFDAKHYDNYLRFCDKTGQSLMSYEIFKTRMQIGITKNTDYISEEDADEGRFFKHEIVKFNNDKEKRITYRFAFYAEIEDELHADFVYLGAERSCFKMKVEPQTNEKDLHQLLLEIYPNTNKNGRIVLISPTFVEDLKKLGEMCLFHWSFLTPFRNLVQAKTGQGKLKSGIVSYNRKDTDYNMLCAGTVLLFDESNRQEIEKMLNDGHLQAIGYNYYDSMK